MHKAPTATSLQSSSQGENSQSSRNSGQSQGEGLKWLDEDPVASGTKRDEVMLEGDGTESDGEEALEKVEIDPLVFSREEFDAGETCMYMCNLALNYIRFSCSLALHQAGRHMEDSIIAAYTALLLGILSKHNQVLLSLRFV